MEIIVAKTAGFCFGVDLAVNKVNELISDNKQWGNSQNENPIYTYGPIIHNPTVVEDLAKQGVEVIHTLEDLSNHKEGTVLIRSHGISKEELQVMNRENFKVVDATCPYVRKIHRIVQKASGDGLEVIIVGSRNHPEIKAIAGWVTTKVHYIEDLDGVDSLLIDPHKSYSIVAQTTFDYKLYEEILNKLQKKSIHVIINETICNATVERQIEARELSKKVTKMIVIGGKNSSNTRKLYEICKSQCNKTYYIETIEDLVLNVFTVSDIIGITAGASTPKNIIEEVISNVRNAEF